MTREVDRLDLPYMPCLRALGARKKENELTQNLDVRYTRNGFKCKEPAHRQQSTFGWLSGEVRRPWIWPLQSSVGANVSYKLYYLCPPASSCTEPHLVFLLMTTVLCQSPVNQTRR
jgi:hypothetical protein